jgi:hypothetical protein
VAFWGDAGPSKKECAPKPTPYAIWRNRGPSMRGGQRGVLDSPRPPPNDTHKYKIWYVGFYRSLDVVGTPGESGSCEIER